MNEKTDFLNQLRSGATHIADELCEDAEFRRMLTLHVEGIYMLIATHQTRDPNMTTVANRVRVSRKAAGIAELLDSYIAIKVAKNEREGRELQP